MSQSLTPARSSLRYATTTRGSSAGGLVVAVLLHVAIVAVTLFTWQHKLDLIDETPPNVPVDLVTIADKTNVMPTVERTAKPAPADEVKPPPQDTPVPTPSPAAAAEPAPEPAPAPPTAKPEVAPKVQAKPPEPQKPTETKKPKSDDFAALLNALTAPAATPRNAKPGTRTIKGVGDMTAMTADIATALRSQIVPCWSPPVGAPRAEQLVVDFDLILNQDGSVARPPQLTADSAGRAASDPYTRAAAEAARRAIMTCAPYKLPADRYSVWREISPFHFDPRQMMGQ